jgi:subtilisin family serine protease
MAKKTYFPSYYYLILFLLTCLVVLFWVSFFYKNIQHTTFNNTNSTNQLKHPSNQHNIPINNGNNVVIPIDTASIIIDSASNRKVVGNLINVATVNQSQSILAFANDFYTKYDSLVYDIIFIDTTINRCQIKLPDSLRTQFKNEVKSNFKNYNLLVWEESIFNTSKTFNDPQNNNPDQNWYLNAININNLWDKTIGDNNIKIAVIDNGFDIEHVELKGKIILPYNTTNRTINVKPSAQNHGTHVASTILANSDNSSGITGIIPNCSLMPIKVEDDNGFTTSTYIVDAILFAIKNKASVINLSMGMAIPLIGAQIDQETQKEIMEQYGIDEEDFWDQLFAYANRNNTTIVLAAGNNNLLTGIDPMSRSINAIKVGAYDANLKLTAFSNYGNRTTIFAPGEKIYGAAPNNNYEYLSGTSMAAPIVTGVIALFKAQDPGIGYVEIIKKIMDNSTQKNGIRILKIK